MADIPVTTGLVVLGVTLAEAIKWLARSLAQKPHHDGENGSSGMKPASWWELKIGDIVQKKLEQHEACLREIIREELNRK